MLKLVKIAITGGIATGKSTVGKIFQELGAYLVDADAIVHELLASNKDLTERITRLLGKEVLDQGQLSRSRIANKVFRDLQLLHALEKYLHPMVFEEISRKYEEACQGAWRAFVVEMPLLYEVHQENFYDFVVAVAAERSLCIKRSKLSEKQYLQRMSRQLEPEKKAERADYVIYNQGSLSDLRNQVNQALVQWHL